jgi:hypothetical protein
MEAARALQMRGFKIGPAGWRLIVSHKISNSANSLEYGLKSYVSVPKVDYLWQLLDAQGNEVWRTTGEFLFQYSGSRYFTKSRDAYDYAPGERQLTVFEEMEYYDFGRRDPRAAMEEEILERGPGVGLLERLPKLLLKSGDKYPTCPVSREMPVKKGDEAGGEQEQR